MFENGMWRLERLGVKMNQPQIYGGQIILNPLSLALVIVVGAQLKEVCA